MSSRIVSVGIACVVALALSGCQADVAVEDEESVSEQEILERYFGLLSQIPVASPENVADFAAAGSPAQQYFSQLTSRVNKALDDGVVDDAGFEVSYDYRVVEEDSDEEVIDTVSLCLDQSEYPDAATEDFCFLFDEFEFVDGRLSAFSTQGDPIHGQILLGYFSAIAKVQPDDILKAQKLSAPGSPADNYALQQSHVAQADVDSGSLDLYAAELEFRDGEIVLDYSADYRGFVFDQDRLVSFIAGDTALEETLSVYDEEEIKIGTIGSLKLLSAYRSISGLLFVTVEVTSDTSILYIPYDATYIGENGRGMDEAWSVAPFELRKDRVANAYWVFSGGNSGGELELRFNNQNWRETVVKVPVS